MLGGSTASCEQSLSVTVDHPGGLPPPRLQDRRQLDAARDHVLHRAHACAVAGEGLDDVVWNARALGHPLVDARHLARVELLADRSVLAYRPKQVSVVDFGAADPRIDQLDGVPGWRTAFRTSAISAKRARPPARSISSRRPWTAVRYSRSFQARSAHRPLATRLSRRSRIAPLSTPGVACVRNSIS